MIYHFEKLRFSQVFKNISLSTKPEVNHSVYGRLQTDPILTEFKSSPNKKKYLDAFNYLPSVIA
jgi:hypothetical protein